MPPIFAAILFADAEVQNGLTVFALLSGVANGLFGWLTVREKLKYDAEIVTLRRDVAALTEKTDACHAERDELRDEIDDLRRLVYHRTDRRQGDDPAFDGPEKRTDRPSGVQRLSGLRPIPPADQ